MLPTVKGTLAGSGNDGMDKTVTTRGRVSTTRNLALCIPATGVTPPGGSISVLSFRMSAKQTGLTRTTVYQEHPSFTSPTDPNIKLWRYMDLAKFLGLLEDEALFFATAANMSDKFEGARSSVNVAARSALAAHSKEHKGLGVFQTLVEAPLAHLLTRYTYLSCWHSSEYESAAMWSLYQHDGRGIAIRTTFSRLTQSFKTDKLIYAGAVKYVDYSKTFIPDDNSYDAFMHKRLSFEHEREVRAVTSNYELAMEIWHKTNQSYGPTDTAPHVLAIPDDYPAGLNIPVDLTHMVEAVYISPEAESWFTKLVEELIHRYGHTWPVYQSDLGEDPVY